METEIKEDQKEFIEIELLSPLTGEFYTSGSDYGELEDSGIEDGAPLDGADLLQYEESIRTYVEAENQMDEKAGNPCNLMEYFWGSDVVKDKVKSAVVSVKNIDGVLYGCTMLKIREPLDEEEMYELKDYIQGQYSDGWGEGFEQREIPVDGGWIYVHFWQCDDFQFLNVEETAIGGRTDDACKRPKLKLLGHDGNIFSIMADAKRLLIQNGQKDEADEMIDRVKNSGDYYRALHIISEYVETELSHPVQKSGQREQKEEQKEVRNRKSGECR